MLRASWVNGCCTGSRCALLAALVRLDSMGRRSWRRARDCSVQRGRKIGCTNLRRSAFRKRQQPYPARRRGTCKLAGPGAATAFSPGLQAALAAMDGMTTQQSSLLGALLIDYSIQLVGWALACLLRTDKTYDMFGSLTFFTLSLASLAYGGVFHWRQVLNSVFVCLWATRLGSFLVFRVFKMGGDSRLEPVKNKPGVFLAYWMVQGVWVFVTMLPLLALNSSPAAVTPTPAGQCPVTLADALGWALWGSGFVIEAVADLQKWRFKSDPANQGRYIDTGLWRYARYPNYGGEMLVWAGVYASCSSGWASPWWYLYSAASPLFVVYILTCLSGIPIQEKQAQQRWGAESNYQEYRRRTRLLLPLPKLF